MDREFLAFENAQEDEDDLQGLSFDALHDVGVVATDWTVSTIVDFLSRGAIELSPSFQRRRAWSAPKKCRFIESLFMGLPIPQIVLAEERRGKFLVVDGKQRLLTLQEFLTPLVEEDRLVLTGLEFLKDLNGETFETLSGAPEFSDDINAFETHTIRTVLIKNWKLDEKILYLFFLRLNTGSLQLSPQELRRALHPGPFIDHLDEFTNETEIFEKYFGFRKPDFRMRDVEVTLRYLAFRKFLPEYRGNMKEFLDKTTKSLNKSWKNKKSEILEDLDKFERSVNTSHKIFQKNLFRKWKQKKYEPAKNRAIIDIMTFYFADENIASIAEKNTRDVETAFKKLCASNKRFLSSIEGTTKSLENTVVRLSDWGKTLEKILKIDLPIPELDENKKIQF